MNEEDKSGIVFKFPDFDYEPTKEELNIENLKNDNTKR